MQLARRIMADLREIRNLTFEDAPEVYVTDPDSAHPTSDSGLSQHQGASVESCLTALVVGPPATPYAHAFFTFRLSFPCQYPNECPRVKFLTTDDSRVRMNPNLYANGKVCLSILGTWRGESPDSWRSSYSVAYLLRCLQSLVLTSAPYHNEPGFERRSESAPLTDDALGYNEKIFHESMRIAVIQVLEALYHVIPPPSAAPPPIFMSSTPTPNSWATDGGMAGVGLTDSYGGSLLFPATSPFMTGGDASPGLTELNENESPLTVDAVATPLAPSSAAQGHDLFGADLMATEAPPREGNLEAFAPMIKRHADLWMEFYESELSIARRHRLDGIAFPLARFECRSQNCCAGVFQFAALSERLQVLQAAMDDEAKMWVREGTRMTAKGAHQSCIVQIMQSELNYFRCGSETPSTQTGGEPSRAAPVVPSFVSASLVDPGNLFHWQFAIMNPSEGAYRQCVGDGTATVETPWTLYEQSMYTIDVVFCPLSLEYPPRIRFMQKIFHPNISPRRGVPFCFATENLDAGGDYDRRFLPTTVARQLAKLLSLPPMCSEAAAVNVEAWRQCFSADEAQRKAFQRTARQLSERTMEC